MILASDPAGESKVSRGDQPFLGTGMGKFRLTMEYMGKLRLRVGRDPLSSYPLCQRQRGVISKCVDSGSWGKRF